MLLLSCRQYWKAIEILSETAYWELSYFFLKYCIQNEIINLENQNLNDFKNEELNNSCSKFLEYTRNNIDKIGNNIAKRIFENYIKLKNQFNYAI